MDEPAGITPLSWFKRIRLVISWLLALYLGWMFVRNGWMKFSPDGFWARPFERWGIPVWLRLVVGVIEFAGGLLLIVPRSATYAGLAILPVMITAGVMRASAGWWVDAGWIAAYASGLAWIAWEWRGFRWREGGRRRPQDAPVR